MDPTTALARLERMVAADQEPVLDAATIQDLLVMARRQDAAGNDPRNTPGTPARAASTLYSVNDLVRQNASTERWWICQWAGTTGTTVPAWPAFYVPRTDSTVYDGTVVWADAGSRWQPTFDFNYAAAAGWESKAAALAHRFDFAADGQRFDRSKAHAMCLQMADVYRRRINSTLIVVAG